MAGHFSLNNDPGSMAADDSNFDMNDFVNFDQGFVASPTTASIKLEPQHAPDGRTTMGTLTSHAHMYNGPSHDYGQFRQQTGLPVGAVSHVKAVNAYSNQIRPTTYSAPTFPGYNTGFDVDFDALPANDLTTYFYPSMDTHQEEYAVDPSSLAPDAQPMNATRAWPGMHSQQAKAEAAAKDAETAVQEEGGRQQLGLQQTLPTNFEQTFGNRIQPHQTSEPEVNDQISRLLNQMRHNSDASNTDDDNDSNAGDSGPSRMKKDEDDMDEDERLLASEEGKKLTSKERRQLRNKVSARAFRSRRKEYITQLEGEVADKVSECNDLKDANRQLMEQNRQLTALTRTMLAHPSFNTFMQEMSNDPAALDAHVQRTVKVPNDESYRQPQQQQHDQQQTEPVQVGMSMMPENNLNLSMLNLGANHWGGGSFTQPRIYAVHELPEGPSLEDLQASRLSGKPSSDSALVETGRPSKVELPTVESPQSVSVPEVKCDYPVMKEHPAVASDTLSVDSSNSVCSLAPQSSPNRSWAIHNHTTPERDDCVIDEAEAFRRIERMIALLDPTHDRIAAMIFQLPR